MNDFLERYKNSMKEIRDKMGIEPSPQTSNLREKLFKSSKPKKSTPKDLMEFIRLGNKYTVKLFYESFKIFKKNYSNLKNISDKDLQIINNYFSWFSQIQGLNEWFGVVEDVSQNSASLAYNHTRFDYFLIKEQLSIMINELYTIVHLLQTINISKDDKQWKESTEKIWSALEIVNSEEEKFFSNDENSQFRFRIQELLELNHRLEQMFDEITKYSANISGYNKVSLLRHLEKREQELYQIEIHSRGLIVNNMEKKKIAIEDLINHIKSKI